MNVFSPNDEIDVLVTCYPHSDRIEIFPQVRGFYLAQHLARAGLRAEFRQLPLPGFKCKVLICSEYQSDMQWFEGRLAGPLREIRADRWFCLVDASLRGHTDEFSYEVCRWFASRGGVLCHLNDDELEPYEHWVGLGVDAEVVRPAVDGRRNYVLFDFPRSSSVDTASTFEVSTLDVLRQTMPDYRLIGCGPADAAVRHAFDGWIEYGQPHSAFVGAAFAGALAVVPGRSELMGMAHAEAQVAGACVVASADQVPKQILVPEATVTYEAGNGESLARALALATTRDPARIREQALQHFNFADVIARTRAAIKL